VRNLLKKTDIHLVAFSFMILSAIAALVFLSRGLFREAIISAIVFGSLIIIKVIFTLIFRRNLVKYINQF